MDLFQIMMSAQVINGVLLPILLVFLVFIASDKHIMGRDVYKRQAFDTAAAKRLGIDLDTCLIWTGMDVRLSLIHI